MVKSGLPVPFAALMAVLVNAGSAQLAALPLLVSGAPLWVIFATAFCVNLRFVIYSAHWAKYFGHMPRRQRLTLGYFAGDGWSSWMGASLLGIVLADRVPTEWGLGFAGVLALLGIAYSLLSGTKSWVAGAVAACAAVAAFSMPFKLNIVVGIAAGIAAGLLLDRTFPDTAVERAS